MVVSTSCVAPRSRTGRAHPRTRFSASPQPARASSAASGACTPLTSREGVPRGCCDPAARHTRPGDATAAGRGLDIWVAKSAKTRRAEDSADRSGSYGCHGCYVSWPLARVGSRPPGEMPHQAVFEVVRNAEAATPHPRFGRSPRRPVEDVLKSPRHVPDSQLRPGLTNHQATSRNHCTPPRARSATLAGMEAAALGHHTALPAVLSRGVAEILWWVRGRSWG